jgi:hypothetical protein
MIKVKSVRDMLRQCSFAGAGWPVHCYDYIRFFLSRSPEPVYIALHKLSFYLSVLTVSRLRNLGVSPSILVTERREVFDLLEDASQEQVDRLENLASSRDTTGAQNTVWKKDALLLNLGKTNSELNKGYQNVGAGI